MFSGHTQIQRFFFCFSLVVFIPKETNKSQMDDRDVYKELFGLSLFVGKFSFFYSSAEKMI